MNTDKVDCLAYKKGAKVTVLVRGAGVTSYEPDIIKQVRNVFDAETGARTNCEPSLSEFSFKIGEN